MAQIPTISMEVDKTQALRDIKALRSAMLGLRKTIVDTNKVNKQFNTVVGGSKTKKALGGATKSTGQLNEKLFELGKAAQFAAGPLSGFAARLTAFSSLVGRTNVLLAAGVAAMAAFGVGLKITTQAAAEFELGLIGVSKASSLVGKSLGDFGKDILKLSSDLALPSGELLTIAESAARLGIDGSEDLQKFTKTVGMVTRATDLTAESASTAFARILKVTGTSVKEVDSLANVIVRLGNNVAATESEITEVALSVARASGVFGVGANDAATLGAAFAQFGVQAEVAGSTIGRVLGTINDGLKSSGTTAQTLASIMGRSLGDVRDTFENDALGGIFQFLGGIKQLETEGVSAVRVLREFGLSGIREAKSLLPLIDNIEEVARVIALSNSEFKDQSALMIEFGRFSEAASIIFQGLGVNFKNIAIRLGQEFLPSIKKVAAFLRVLTGDADKVVEVLGRIVKGIILYASVIVGGGFIKATFTAAIAMTQLRKAIAGVSLASLASGKSLKLLLAGMIAVGVFSETMRDKLKSAGQAVNDLFKNTFGIDLEEQIGLMTALLFGKGPNAEDIAEEVKNIDAEIQKLMGTLGKGDAGGLFDEGLQTLEKNLKSVFTNSVNSFEQALKSALKGDGDFFTILFDGIKDAFIGGIAAGITESAKKALFAPLFQDIFSVLLGGNRGTALAESSAGLPSGSLEVGKTSALFGDLGESLGDAVNALDMFAFNTFGIGKGVFGQTGIEDQQSGEVIKGIESLVGVTDGLGSKIKDFGSSLLQGGLLGGAVGGGSLGSIIGGGLGKVLGDVVGKSLSKVGGKLGKALGPLGGIIGSLAGGFLGGLFSKTPRSQATLVGGGVGGTFTRGSGQERTGLGLAGSVGDALNSLASALGGDIQSKKFGTIGQRGEEFFFDPRTGGGLGPKDLGDPKEFRFASAEEAVRVAIRTALDVGVVSGLSESVSKVLRSSPVEQSLEALISDLQFAQLFDEAFGTLDLGLSDFEKSIQDLNKSFDESARSAKRLGLEIQRVEDARKLALLNQRIDFNKEIELLILDIVDPLQAELKRLEETQDERLRDVKAIGGNIAAVEALNQLERQNVVAQFGSTTTNIFKEFLRELTATTQSALAPEVSVQNASREFSNLRGRFLGGETGVAQELITAGRDLLDIRRSIDASGPGFFDTLQFVQDTIEQAMGVDSISGEDSQLQILEDIAFANAEAIAQRAEMIELLKNQTSTVTNGGGNTGDTPNLGPRFTQTGIGGGSFGSGLGPRNFV